MRKEKQYAGKIRYYGNELRRLLHQSGEGCILSPGMEQCSVNLLKNSMVVNYDDHTLTSSQIVEAVEEGRLRGSPGGKRGTKTAAGAKVSPVDTARQEYESMRGG